MGRDHPIAVQEVKHHAPFFDEVKPILPPKTELAFRTAPFNFRPPSYSNSTKKLN